MAPITTDLSSTLAPDQAQVVLALAQGSTVSAAAKAAGIHRCTIHEWLRSSDDFKKSVAQARQDFVANLQDELSDMLLKSVAKLHAILDNPEAPLALQAKVALAMLNHTRFPKLSSILAEKLVPDSAPADPAKPNPTLSDTSDGVPAEPTRQNPTLFERVMNSAASPVLPFRRPFPKIGRNEPCPCGSGKKFKHCCLGKPDMTGQAATKAC